MTRKQIFTLPVIMVIMLIAAVLGLILVLVMIIPVMIYPPLIEPIANRATATVTQKITRFMFRARNMPGKKVA
jgi:branched-subunit amino acid ABC-type transport system permease component